MDKPLSDETLAVIERDYNRVLNDLDAHPLIVRGVAAYVPILLAQVRQTRPVGTSGQSTAPHPALTAMLGTGNHAACEARVIDSTSDTLVRTYLLHPHDLRAVRDAIDAHLAAE